MGSTGPHVATAFEHEVALGDELLDAGAAVVELEEEQALVQGQDAEGLAPVLEAVPVVEAQPDAAGPVHDHLAARSRRQM